jgi:hypothetical protein
MNFGNRGAVILCTFLFAVILCSVVSAASIVNFSSDGKNITITPNNVPSTLTTSESSAVKSGTYGYGQYITLKETGKDTKGMNIYRTGNVYNNILESMVNKFSSVDGVTSATDSAVLSNNKYVVKMIGKDGNLTFSGTGVIPIFNVNGHKVENNGIKTINYYVSGKLLATSNITTVFKYQFINGDYQTLKMTDTTNTLYTNGNTRTSIITQLYSRNSKGTETGMVTTGTSKGTEKVNNKIVSYTGKITISTRHDPKDYLDEGYVTGTYKEVRTSSSPVLNKEIPLEAVRLS